MRLHQEVNMAPRALGVCKVCGKEAVITTAGRFPGSCLQCYNNACDRARRQALPERLRKPPTDKGCELSPSCLLCELHTCPKARSSNQHPPVTRINNQKQWRTSPEWRLLNHIPSKCPHCGSSACQDGFPDEVYCFHCGPTILPWVPLPKNWSHTPAKASW